MKGQLGFFDLQERYAQLSKSGDPLEKLGQTVDFEPFRYRLAKVLKRSDGGKGGRPPDDPVLMFKVLILQSLYTLSDEKTEFQIRDRLSFQRFLGLSVNEPVPDATTIWLFREQLTKVGAIDKLFRRFDELLKDRGYLAMSGQIVDASLIRAPRQHLDDGEKGAIKAGKTAAGIWPDQPAKAAQKDTDARSAANEAFLASRGKTSRIRRKKPKGKPMPQMTARANAKKSMVRAGIEHVFGHQKGPMDLVIRIIGIARAKTKIGLANLACNMKRLVWLDRRTVFA